ncbi:hypothetical protein DES53_105197 [Roseimicrobium gellanilyticum]|uniref:Uncharacterized protein n=1 Tax=Roseimicrobium gellanilyticum TaxID=748857 RepID=A0A366HLI3_9BACT|nr:hypothetical protein [Roseimicrobium gellanilyticum]RBP43798.1 hypothetical protein DES53_105197 [Roseimicrobium gellanilyticum]
MAYQVTFAEVNTGIVLNEDSSRFLGPGESPVFKFEAIEDAREYAQTWLSTRPHAEAWIGTDGDPQLEYVISENFIAYDRERRSYEFWVSLPLWRRWFTPKPSMMYYHPN